MNEEEGFLRDSTHLILDRDSSFLPLREYLKRFTQFEPVLLSPKSPNLNAHMERFMRSLKQECLNRMILFGRRSLDTALREYVEHYHTERPHQGIGNVVPFPEQGGAGGFGSIKVRKRLGGLLKHYHRAA